MTPDIPWWTKLWWRGLDVAVNVMSATISAGIVWLFARIFVRWKHDEDLRFEKRKAEQALALQGGATTNALRIQLEDFVARVQSTSGAEELGVVVKQWRKWLDNNNLLPFGGNLGLSDDWASDSRFTGPNANANFESFKKDILRDIGKTVSK
jgi:hypothetical protein